MDGFPALWKFSRTIAVILLTVSAASPEALADQPRRVSVAFYNVENLFDTVPSPFYDDREFTPRGANAWNTERYTRKTANIARVIDDAGFDVVALAEVENETALRDLAQTLTGDYTYIHRTGSDRRGIDIALLYKADKFFPEEVRLIGSGTTREFLFVCGNLLGSRTGILVCHLPSKFNGLRYRERAAMRLAEVSDSLLSQAECSRLVVMGDFNGELHEAPMRKAFGDGGGKLYLRGMMQDALHEWRINGFGTYCWDGEWFVYDNLLVSAELAQGEGLRLEKAGIFVRDYMLEGVSDRGFSNRRGYPRRTFSGGRYLGGYSDHLPVFAVFTG